MKIELHEIKVSQLCEDFEDNAEAGVVGYGGKLDIRPPYQREFIYKDKQRDAVIDTVRKDYPLNVMYWAVREDGKLEVIDGQQRTLSICQYVNGDFSINGLAFSADGTALVSSWQPGGLALWAVPQQDTALRAIPQREGGRQERKRGRQSGCRSSVGARIGLNSVVGAMLRHT